MIERIFSWTALGIVGMLVAYLAHAAARSWLVGVPADYFTRSAPPHGTLQHAVRTIVGATLVALGIVMLVTPGPGILAIALGLLITDGGGKHAMARRLIRMKRIATAMDAIRRQAGQPPLVRP